MSRLLRLVIYVARGQVGMFQVYPVYSVLTRPLTRDISTVNLVNLAR